MSNRSVFGGVISLLMGLMLVPASVTSAQVTPEFTPQYWKDKRLPDSMKGMRPEDLAAIARVNEAARRARTAAVASPRDKSVRRADGSLKMAHTQSTATGQVVQTGAATPVGRQPATMNQGGLLRGIKNVVPSALRGPGAPAAQRPGPRIAGAPVGPQVDPLVGQVGPAPMTPESQHVVTLLEAAQNAKNANDLNGAREAYRKVLKIEPYNRGALIQVGRVEHAMGKLDNAISAYEYLLRIDPNNAVGLNDLGLCQARKGDMEASLKSLQAAVVAQPRSLRYRNNLAKVLIETNQVEAAVGVMTQLRGKAMGQATIGALLAARGRNEEARTYLQNALVEDPNLQAARTKLASLAAEPAGQVATATNDETTAATAIRVGAEQLELTPPERNASTMQR